MLTITSSSDTYYEAHPVTLGILVRGDLAATWDLVEEVKQASADIPVCISCTSAQSDSSRRMLHQFSRTTIIEHHEGHAPGEQVNEIMRRSTSPFTSICWSDMELLSDNLLAAPQHDRVLCRVPILEDMAGHPLPVRMVPYGRGESIGFVPLDRGNKTMIPTDYTGMYDTPQFLSVGGYAPGFTQPFWQLSDFGSRVWLWGHALEVDAALRLRYRRKTPVYDQTRGLDYYRWFRRNCAVKRVRGVLKQTRTFLHQRASEERRWVEQHQHRFMRSMEEVVARWEEL